MRPYQVVKILSHFSTSHRNISWFHIFSHWHAQVSNSKYVIRPEMTFFCMNFHLFLFIILAYRMKRGFVMSLSTVQMQPHCSAQILGTIIYRQLFSLSLLCSVGWLTFRLTGKDNDELLMKLGMRREFFPSWFYCLNTLCIRNEETDFL